MAPLKFNTKYYHSLNILRRSSISKKESKKYVSLTEPSYCYFILSVILLFILSFAIPSNVMTSHYVFATPEPPPEEEQPPISSGEEICEDGIDNDNDGLMDERDCLVGSPLPEQEPGPDEQRDVLDGDNLPAPPAADDIKFQGGIEGKAFEPDAPPPGGTTTPGSPDGTTTPSGPTPDSTYDCLSLHNFKIGKWELITNPEIGDACDPDAPPIVAAEQSGACSAVATSGPTYIGEDGCPQPCPTEGQDIPTGCPLAVPLDPEAEEAPPVLFKPKRIIIPDDIASGPLIAPPEEAPEPQECGQGEAFNELTGQCEPVAEPTEDDPENGEGDPENGEGDPENGEGDPENGEGTE